MAAVRHVRRQLLRGGLRLVPLCQPNGAKCVHCVCDPVTAPQISVTVTSVDPNVIGLGALPVALSATTRGIGAPAPGSHLHHK